MRAFLNGFRYAARGVARAVRTERNVRFHLCAAVYVLVFSRFYSLTRAENTLIVLLIAGVLGFELLNTAVERMVDRFAPGYDTMAGAVKDMAAGAVLVFCAGSAVCGFLLFWNVAVFVQMVTFFVARPALLALFVVSLAASVWFIFFWGRTVKPKG